MLAQRWSLALGAWATVLGCASAPPTPKPAAPTAPAPAPPQRTKLGPEDRLPMFDRLAFASPVAAIYDVKRDVYWVTNEGGEASLQGPKGFVSRLDAEGAVAVLNYIDGNREGVELNAPRGLAIRGDQLWIADRDQVRSFDADTGQAVATVAVPNAQHLSDVAVAPDGSIYATDLGAPVDGAGTAEGPAGQLYRISPDLTVTALGAPLPDCGPVALTVSARRIAVACAASNQLLRFPFGGPEALDTPSGTELPTGRLHGLVELPDSVWLSSSWEGRGVLLSRAVGGGFPLITGLETPCDLGYDSTRHRLVVPLTGVHAIAIFDLPRPLPLPN